MWAPAPPNQPRIGVAEQTNAPAVLGAFYRRMRARHGAAKAITATANKLAKLIYRMLKHGEQYVARGQDKYEKQYRQRLLNNLERQAKVLGCQVLVLENGEALS